jgi:pimeloyl-ACP methyl ester carboxylesterase
MDDSPTQPLAQGDAAATKTHGAEPPAWKRTIGESTFSPDRLFSRASADMSLLSQQGERMLLALGRHAEQIGHGHGERFRALVERARDIGTQFMHMGFGVPLQEAASAYASDMARRGLLTLDTLRQRGNNDIAHEAAGTPPVLDYDYEVVIDGAGLPRPVNYMLLKILPPVGVTIDAAKQPYMIIDPRAGHGAGIGGFKPDSQVGVALRAGHPVYFVAFRPHPEPGQTIADITRAESEFVKEVIRRHPGPHKPIVVGNCQGGWAAMLLAATNPTLTGPLVINGAPLAYWSGRVGQNPMRYFGGLFGGAVPALFMCDLGHGELDGASLVGNFELLDPGRNAFRKYYDLFADVEGRRQAFLDFERWWGGFHFLSEAEMRWILEQLFVGNRLARGEARIVHGHHLDLRLIRSPIIVFASHGDNITPPQQALDWIVDTYADEQEIRIRGQRVVYMVHEKVGHLGIFVSSSVARREHAEVATTMDTIEALAPGLYEMVIEDCQGEGYETRFVVSFAERKMSDIMALDENRADESDFAAVARLSEFSTEFYDMFVRPLVQSAVTPQSAELMRSLHPMRVARRFFSDRNPLMGLIAAATSMVEGKRTPVAADNPFTAAERLAADAVEQALDFARDLRDTGYELAFQAIYGLPMLHWIGRTHDYHRSFRSRRELRYVPQIQAILFNIGRGGFAEAVIRMLIILAGTRGAIRRDRLERSSRVISQDEPFASLGPETRAALIHEQTVIVEFERDRAIETLPLLVPTPEQRQKAIDVVQYIAGAVEEMEPYTIQTMQRFRKVLGLSPLDMRVPASDPLQPPPDGPASAAA